MLKSIEKLRNISGDPSLNLGTTKIIRMRQICEDLADEIQREVDKFYLSLPLFEDGEPVRLGDEFYCPDLGAVRACRIHYTGDHVQIITDIDTSFIVHPGERLKRPLVTDDTQGKIDADTLLSAVDYCDKYDLNYERGSIISYKCCAETVMRRDLLARQRRLDGMK